MARMPSNGPSPSQGKSVPKACRCASVVNSSMLTIEMAKPILLVSVSTLPTACCGALLAVKAENCGESPGAVMPHISNQTANQASDASINQGASTQHTPLMAN